ncbi:MAG TPA: HIT family protein [Actinomycetales bacterium]|jgi:diadenosine tetraphosphate (Ap4A) HIT family hydrolase
MTSDTAPTSLADRRPGCYNCDQDADPASLAPWEAVHRDGLWRVALAYDTSMPGWLVVVPTRHVESLHEVSEDDAAALGRVLRAVSAALVEVTGCVKTYVMLFAEAEGFAHLHVHVVPRPADLAGEHLGPRVFAHLGVPPEKQVSVQARSDLAAALGAVLARRG